MAELFQVKEEQSVKIIDMDLPEEMDSTEFDRLNSSLLALLDDKQRTWVFDLTDVDYMGSAMLGMMVNFRQRVQSVKGRLVLCGVSPKLLEILRACCLERLFPVARTRAEAVKLAK